MPTANPARRPGATSGYVPVNGLDMYYEIHGDGFPLALFHGAMGTIDSCFAGLLPALAATRQVAKNSELDRTFAGWPDEDIRAMTMPMLLIIGDSDIVRPEHTMKMFRLLGGGVIGDLAGLPA